MQPPDTIFSPLPDSDLSMRIFAENIEFCIESCVKTAIGGQMTVVGMEYGLRHPNSWMLYPDGKAIRITNWMAHPDSMEYSICDFLWEHN